MVDTHNINQKGYKEVKGKTKTSDDRYVIENLGTSWTQINDRDVEKDTTEVIDNGKLSPNDSIVLKNMTSKDVMFFFDVAPEGYENKEQNKRPDDGLYIVKKSAMNSVINQMSYLMENDQLEDPSVYSKHLKGGLAEVLYYFGDTNNYTNGQLGTTYGENYIETIQTVDKKGITQTLDVATYIKEVRQEVLNFLKKYPNKSAGDIIYDPGNAKGRNALLNIYKNHAIKVLSTTGTDGNDTIKGGNTDLTLIGGKGDDKLYGGAGKNKFMFEFDSKNGFGNDTVYHSKNATDTLVFTNKNGDLTAKDLSFFRSGKDLKITYNYEKANENTGSVIVKDYFKLNGTHSVKNIEIGGKSQSIEKLLNDSPLYVMGKGKLNGSAKDDVIFGSDSKDTITSYEGNDTIYTYKGNDKIIFDRTAKRTSSAGVEQFEHKIINSDGGMNTIQMSKWNVIDETINVSYDKSNKSMTLQGLSAYTEKYNGYKDIEVTINNFNNNGYTLIDSSKKKFSLLAGAGALNGTKGNDIIFSTGDNDTINTGAGTDYVHLSGKKATVNIGSGNTEIYSEVDKNTSIYNVTSFNTKTSIYIDDADDNNTLNIASSIKDLRLVVDAKNKDSFVLCHKKTLMKNLTSGVHESNWFAPETIEVDEKPSGVHKGNWFAPGTIEVDGKMNKVTTKEGTVDLNSWINDIQSDVQGWLSKNSNYGSLEDVFEKGSNADIKDLVNNVFQNADVSKYIMK